jgi:3-phenylpropionate/cinnamic acid dioxygenase small subunit
MTEALVDWLLEEADQLDQGRFEDWESRLAAEVVYRAPLRASVSGTRADGMSASMDLYFDDRYALSKRMQRLGTDHAWSEDPPIRTRRFVTNIRAYGHDLPGHMVARSNLLVYMTRGDSSPELISAVRRDVFLETEGGLLLSERMVAVDSSILWSQSLTSVL